MLDAVCGGCGREVLVSAQQDSHLHARRQRGLSASCLLFHHERGCPGIGTANAPGTSARGAPTRTGTIRPIAPRVVELARIERACPQGSFRRLTRWRCAGFPVSPVLASPLRGSSMFSWVARDGVVRLGAARHCGFLDRFSRDRMINLACPGGIRKPASRGRGRGTKQPSRFCAHFWKAPNGITRTTRVSFVHAESFSSSSSRSSSIASTPDHTFWHARHSTFAPRQNLSSLERYVITSGLRIRSPASFVNSP